MSPYSDDYEAIKNVPVVCGATLWTDTVDNQEYILVFNESLWMGDFLSHSLINPNQLCAFGTDMQDNPFSTERLSIQPTSHDITIPLPTLHITFASPLMMWRRRVEAQSTPFKCDNNTTYATFVNTMSNQVSSAQSTTQ